MDDWKEIDTAPKSGDLIVWNGSRVFLAWLSDDGWHDSTNPEHDDYPEEPQPTHWMPLPSPPLGAIEG